MARQVTITVPYLGYKLTFDVTYHWEGRYRPATRLDPEERPTLEIDDAQLVEWDGEVPTQTQIRLHGDAELIDRAELYAALVEADEREYPAPDRDDVRYFGCDRY